MVEFALTEGGEELPVGEAVTIVPLKESNTLPHRQAQTHTHTVSS